MLQNRWNLDNTCSSSTKLTTTKSQWIEIEREAVFPCTWLQVHLGLDIEKWIRLIVGQFQKILIGNLLCTEWEKDKISRVWALVVKPCRSGEKELEALRMPQKVKDMRLSWGEVVGWKHVGRCNTLSFKKNQSRMDLFRPRSIRNGTTSPNWIMWN